MKPSLCSQHRATLPMARREFLRAGSLAGFGLTLPHFLQGQAQAAQANKPGRGRARACILLFMWGGPAHQDTWDLKPAAPREFRGDFAPIATKVPGLQICEHLPLLAGHTDKLALIRSMTHTDVNHLTATHCLLTGHDLPNPNGPEHEDWPHYGSLLASLGRGRGPLPPFVSLMPRAPGDVPRFVEQSRGRGAGLLGARWEPMRIDADANAPGYQVADFSLHADVPAERVNRRQALLGRLDAQRRALERQSEPLAAHGWHYERAFALLNNQGVADAFDLSREDPRLRDRYGRNIHGQAVLQARRLVEAGVPLVTVFWQNDGTKNVSVYWDTHSRNFTDLRTRLCPVTDQAFTALLQDLEERGLLDETLVVWTGEFGRTPRVGQRSSDAGAGGDGRDHWPGVFTSVLAGGGIRGGAVHGSSDRSAAFPATDPVRPADLAATIYHCLGVDPHLEIRDRLNRPLVLCDGSPVQAILR